MKYKTTGPTKNSTTTATQSDWLFVDNIFRLHDLLGLVICDRDPKFISTFWMESFSILGIGL